LTSDASPTFNQGNFTALHSTTILGDHFGEHTASHNIILDDTMEAADHGFYASSFVVGICYSTGTAPTTNTTPIGTLFVKYTA